jgi:hypothetical protein
MRPLFLLELTHILGLSVKHHNKYRRFAHI